MPIKLGRDAKIAIGWAFISVAGIYGFVLAKQSVDKSRYESMKIRQRMKASNLGDYQSDRFTKN